MLYFFSGMFLIVFSVLNFVVCSHPVLFVFWFSVFSLLMVLIFFSEGCFHSGCTLFVVEESLSVGMVFVWWMWGGGLLLGVLGMAKAAMVPFHKWLVDVVQCVCSESFLWSLSAHKLSVFLLFLSNLCFELVGVLVMSLMMGVFCFLSVSEVRSFLVVSSSNTFALLLCVSGDFWFRGVSFFCLYIGILVSSFSLSLESAFLFMGMMGIPPFWIFQMKWEVLVILGSVTSLALLVALCAGVSVLVYVRFFFLLTSEGGFAAKSKFSVWFLLSLLVPAF